MKKLVNIYLTTAAVAIFAFALTSCNKSSSLIDPATKDASSASVATTTTGDILIAASTTTSGSLTTSATKDSVFLMHACAPGLHTDTVALSALSTTITTYLTTNYSGYTFQKAFKIINPAGTVIGYVVAINYNGKPVGLKFDASGAFIQVLEQRERNDHDGPGWHMGGRFDNRNGMHPDTIALSALPSAIKSYFTANYATDTLLHAVVTKDTTYIVFSANKGLFATSFNSKLVFLKRIQLYPRPIKTPVLQANLPAAISTYLTTTYAGYVFDKAFVEKVNGVVSKYVVLIDASGTRYAVQFDATGTFIKSTTIK
ncbi:PepSY-like domain-containing protein [Mucilaginibacter boryungensis]|uniref:PepSY-like domain-containing protein n=1 Tax=Mucilaginibacter boryungensis TaxID=768480 RepID=A0ABR9XG01_9SPHI|nr:PepSY-like domain-containing protein [Mucilaginibacter boryungensis]MBE9666196.1 PepSY-like domain-containing protein [Mucilaginibacter boryungensis]